MVVNTWLGFLNGTCEFFDTNNAEIELEIVLAPAHILWNSSIPATDAVAAPTAATYTLSDVYCTISRVMFHDPLYYQIIRQKLESSGLDIGFDSYSTHITSVATNKNINMSFSVNARSLSMLICTGIIPTRSDMTPANNYLLLDGSGVSANAKTMKEVIKIGGVAFNQSKYFNRPGHGLLTSQVEVNSIATSPWPLIPYEIYNENLIAFNQNSDMMSKLHPGIMSIAHWQRNYFMHVVSFAHRGTDMQVGLDGKSSSIDIKWTTTGADGCGNIIPVVFAVKNEVLKIFPAHQAVLAR